MALLLQHGADLEIEDADHNRPIEVAAARLARDPDSEAAARILDALGGPGAVRKTNKAGGKGKCLVS